MGAGVSTQPFVILPLGVPGVGKSTVLNFLIGDESMTTFVAKRAVKGVTRRIQIVSDKRFLGEGDPLISVVDVPGIGDATLNVESFLSEVERELNTTKIDMLLLVLKATDDRLTLGEVMVMNMFNLIKGINPGNVVVVLTRCDLEDAFITERIANLSKSAGKAGVNLNPRNIVRFNKSKESLRPLTGFFKRGAMEFEDDLAKRMNAELSGAGSGEVHGLQKELSDLISRMESMRAAHNEEIRRIKAEEERREIARQKELDEIEEAQREQAKKVLKLFAAALLISRQC